MEPRKRFCGDKNQTEMQAHARMLEKRQECEMQDTVKAVTFVPYTVGSELVKRMRDAEEKLLETSWAEQSHTRDYL